MEETTQTELNIDWNAPDLQLLQESWPNMTQDERKQAFARLSRPDAEELFLNISSGFQYELIFEMGPPGRRSWVRLLAPDDAADLIQQFLDDERAGVLNLLDPQTKREVTALLAYAEDEAGGLMNPRFIRLRADVPVDVAIRYLRAQAKKTEVEVYKYAYVLGPDQKLHGTVSFRDLLLAPPDKTVAEIMVTEVVSVPEDMDQEEVSRVFSTTGFTAVPVVDTEGRMKGLVTVDDVVEVVQEEATEDMQKLGGTAALDEPYLETTYWHMVRKRAGWLIVLFVGEMGTATAMAHYEKELAAAIVLALFIPLIISSGGNSGSQATSLIIRALALQEIRLRDWGRVLVKELYTGLTLGLILGVIGFVRIVLWPSRDTLYGPHYFRIALAVSLSLVGVVLWGCVTGSMLPFILRRFGLDPATASAPFVATLVDVSGLVIYFTLASIFLTGFLL
ncbi:MAG: magnesium transporter [Bdellovibrionia bacterium]